MEIDIQSKVENPLLKRTEIRFVLHHNGEGTPKRELVRTELAQKLKVSKENVMLNFLKSNFGKTDTIGYAKVYKSIKEAKIQEREHIQKRNHVIAGEKKPDVKKEEKPEEQPTKPEEKPAPQQETSPEEKPKSKEPTEKSEQPAKKPQDDAPAKEKKEES
jgi:small subunit ribosomal protein S24e